MICRFHPQPLRCAITILWSFGSSVLQWHHWSKLGHPAQNPAVLSPFFLTRKAFIKTRGDRNRWERAARSKRETTSVAWTRVFKHCSFKTTDFKPLKQKTDIYACAISFCVERSTPFLFATLNNYINTLYASESPRLCNISSETQRFRS